MDFYLWVLHPVAHLSNWFLMMPSIATKFQYVNSPFFIIFSFYSLHVSAPTGHPQVRYTIDGSEHYSRGHQLCSHLIVSQHFMETEVS
jgi:hypothetical protein